MRMPTDHPAYVAPDYESDPELNEEERQEELELSLIDPPYRQEEDVRDLCRLDEELQEELDRNLDDIFFLYPEENGNDVRGPPTRHRGQNKWEGPGIFTQNATEDLHLEFDRLEFLVTYELGELASQSGLPPPPDLWTSTPSLLATHQPNFRGFIHGYNRYVSFSDEEILGGEHFEVYGLGWPDALWLKMFLKQHDPPRAAGESTEEWSSKRIDFLSFARKMWKTGDGELLQDRELEFVSYEMVRLVISMALFDYAKALDAEVVASGRLDDMTLDIPAWYRRFVRDRIDR